jgi:hypothetical protein
MRAAMHTEPNRRATPRCSAKLWRVLFAAWCALSVTLVSALGAAHFYALPAPSVGDVALARAVGAVRAGRPQVLLHFLYAKCKCSRRIFDHLLARGALAHAAEQVVLVDGDAALAARLRSAGFAVSELASRELAQRYGVSAAPLLVVAGTADTPAYVGGYTTRKQGLEVEDVRIARDVARGVPTALLPLFGCAVSEQLQRLLDPLGLKYGPFGPQVGP